MTFFYFRKVCKTFDRSEDKTPNTYSRVKRPLFIGDGTGGGVNRGTVPALECEILTLTQWAFYGKNEITDMGGVSLAKLVGQNALADGFHVKIGRFNVDKP